MVQNHEQGSIFFVDFWRFSHRGAKTGRNPTENEDLDLAENVQKAVDPVIFSGVFVPRQKFSGTPK